MYIVQARGWRAFALKPLVTAGAISCHCCHLNFSPHAFHPHPEPPKSAFGSLTQQRCGRALCQLTGFDKDGSLGIRRLVKSRVLHRKRFTSAFHNIFNLMSHFQILPGYGLVNRFVNSHVAEPSFPKSFLSNFCGAQIV